MFPFQWTFQFSNIAESGILDCWYFLFLIWRNWVFSSKLSCTWTKEYGYRINHVSFQKACDGTIETIFFILNDHILSIYLLSAKVAFQHLNVGLSPLEISILHKHSIKTTWLPRISSQLLLHFELTGCINTIILSVTKYFY